MGFFRIDDLPTHTSNSVLHSEIGVSKPSRIDSLIPGMESKYMVSWIAFQSSSEIRTALERFPVIVIGRCDNAVSSIKLQQVCSTLWEKRREETKLAPLAAYEACGGAAGILAGIIGERLNRVPRRRHKSMVRLQEALKKPDNTGCLRTFEDLRGQVKAGKPAALEALLKTLSAAGILREGVKTGQAKKRYCL